MHDALIVGVPLAAILAGIHFNRSDIKELRTEMIARFSKMDGHLGRIDADLRQFYHLSGKLEGRMVAIAKRN